MTVHFEVQARLIEHRDGVRVRDEVRLTRADTRDDALQRARSLVADGFTVWVYRVQAGSGTRPIYRTVDVFGPERPLSPRRRPGSADKEPRDRAPQPNSWPPRRGSGQAHDPPSPAGRGVVPSGVVPTEGDGACHAG